MAARDQHEQHHYHLPHGLPHPELRTATRKHSLKLDELIRTIELANNSLLDLQGMNDKKLDRIREEYALLAGKEQEGRAGKF